MTRKDAIKQFVNKKWGVTLSDDQIKKDKFEFDNCEGFKCPVIEEGETSFDLCDRCKYLGFWEGDADEIL